MALIDTSITINQPVEKVFGFLSNPENLKSIQQGVTGITLTTSGPIGVGTKYKISGEVMGRKFDIENEIVAYEVNKKISIKTPAPPPASPVTNTYTFEPAGGGTKVTAIMDTVIMTGGMPGMEDMIKGQLKGPLDATLATVKKLLGG
jgi:uncharacterized protein YndB with AHSA1/START domain